MGTTTKKLTCIVCPMGCSLEIQLEDGAVKSVTGNTCKRGLDYAHHECTNPLRTVTSTVKCENGDVVAVKTDRPIPKKNVMECMKIINNAVAYFPIRVGDVIIKDVFGSNIVATANKNR